MRTRRRQRGGGDEINVSKDLFSNRLTTTDITKEILLAIRSKNYIYANKLVDYLMINKKTIGENIIKKYASIEDDDIKEKLKQIGNYNDTLWKEANAARKANAAARSLAAVTPPALAVSFAPSVTMPISAPTAPAPPKNLPPAPPVLVLEPTTPPKGSAPKGAAPASPKTPASSASAKAPTTPPKGAAPTRVVPFSFNRRPTIKKGGARKTRRHRKGCRSPVAKDCASFVEMGTRSRRVRKQRGGADVGEKLISHIRHNEVLDALKLLDNKTNYVNVEASYRGAVETDKDSYYNLLGIAVAYNNLPVALALIVRGSDIASPTSSNDAITLIDPLSFIPDNNLDHPLAVIRYLAKEPNMDTRKTQAANLLLLLRSELEKAAASPAVSSAPPPASPAALPLPIRTPPPPQAQPPRAPPPPPPRAIAVGGARKTHRRKNRKHRKSRKHH